MKQVTVNIPEDKYQFFISLVKNLSFVKKVETSSSKKEILDGLQQAVKEVKKIKSGKKKPVMLNDFLNEL